VGVAAWRGLGCVVDVIRWVGAAAGVCAGWTVCIGAGVGRGVGVAVGITRGGTGNGPLSSTGPATDGVGVDVGLGGRVKSCGFCCAASGVAERANTIAARGRLGLVIIGTWRAKRERR